MYKVLIVEDEALLRQGLIHLINWSEHGCIVIGQASNGAEALEITKQFYPDIIITDLVMPVMSGLELTGRIKSAYPDIQMIVISNYDDYKFVRESMRTGVIDYLLKSEISEKKLLDVLEEAKKALLGRGITKQVDEQTNLQVIQAQFFTSLFIRHSIKTESLEFMLKKASIQLHLTSFRLIVFRVKQPPALESAAEQPSEIIMSTIHHFFSYADNYYTLQFNPQDTVVLFNSDPSDLHYITGICRKAAAELDQRTNITMHCMVSRVYYDLIQSGQIYEEIQSIDDFAFYYPKETIFLDDILCSRKVEFNLDNSLINSYIESVHTKSILDYVIAYSRDQLKQGYYFPVLQIRSRLGEIISLLCFRLRQLNVNEQVVREQRFEFIHKISIQKSHHDTVQIFEEILEILSQSLHQVHLSGENPYIKEAKEYLSVHYASDISLNAVAAYLHINKNYLSSLFKEETGENFSNYLITLRMDEAKRLLKQNTLPISSVAEHVGYGNTSYFIQLFKKTSGVTPAEYAKTFKK